MVLEPAQPFYQRFAILGMVLALHLVAIVVLLLQRARPAAQVVKPATIALISVNAERPATAVPPPPVLPAKIAKTFEPVAVVSVPDAGEGDDAAGATVECAPQSALLEGLLRNEGIVDIIRRAPRETRSVADAIVIWNSGWSPVAFAVDSPLARVRLDVEERLGKIEARCLDEPVAGPRLLPIPDGTGAGTIFLVFGSGNWTWRALLTPSPQPQPTDLAEPDNGVKLR